MITDSAREIAQAIEDDLTDRKGLRQAWEAIDDDIREEILATWREKITTILTRAERTDGGPAR
jgi:hypothetical protein